MKTAKRRDDAMSLLSRIQERRKAKRELKEKIRESSRRFGQEKIELEKGDLFAILFSGFFTFILPIMLVLTGMCLFAYFFFTRF